MKILLINTVLGSGSVGRITADLYKSVEAAGDEAIVGVGREPFLAGYKGMLIGNKQDFYQHVVRNFLLGEAGFGSQKTTEAFLQWVDEQKPDLIHIHNIHGFYLQVEMFFDYVKKHQIPVVWTLHDCWPFTGHCAYYDYAACDKWKKGCNNCIHHAKVYPYAIFKDNSVASYARKRKAFHGVKNMTIVTPSWWLKTQVDQSFLKEYKVKVIPNGIDLDVFRPADAPVHHDKHVILGVANIWETRKGLLYFERLAQDLSDDYVIHLIGVSKKQKKQLQKKYGSKMILTERTNGQAELAKAYQEADVFVNPTLEDNFPTTNLEALACGTPVITYDTGGSKESLNDQCGVVVRRGDLDALKVAIVQVASGAKTFDAKACRARAEEYDKDKRYQQYLELYRSICEGK